MNLLQRGYAIIEDDVKIINSVENLKSEKMLKITLKDGKIEGNFTPYK
jgi:exodeoxyribonuclease VII large subunit